MSLAAFVGRKGQAYICEEATYGTTPTILATMAYRHLDLDLQYNPYARVASQEKKQTPGTTNRYSRRTTAGFDLKKSYLIPSGALNTLPEASALLRNGFGTESNITLAATVLTAASTPAEAAPTSTVFAITDYTGLVANLALVVINLAATGKNYVRLVTNIAAAAGVSPKKLITVTPALPSAPALADTVKGMTTYSLATDLQKTVSVVHYLSTLQRVVTGCAVDELDFTVDGMSEIMFSAKGPGQAQGTPAGQPAFTTVGTVIPTGFIAGEVLIGPTAIKPTKVSFNIKNGFKLRNDEVAQGNTATEAYRAGRRVVTCSVDMRIDDALVYTKALGTAGAPIQASFLVRVGDTSGKMWTFYAPIVEFDVPATPDPDDVPIWSMKGVCQETTGNDEIFMGQA
jgi:hypothetical protein